MCVRRIGHIPTRFLNLSLHYYWGGHYRILGSRPHATFFDVMIHVYGVRLGKCVRACAWRDGIMGSCM